ncbi:hypothetical protein [Nocardioides convexus]|uniref:hypothetical protein n=1 Tax=Nocardioides convexus TaxID=2712224 RepID=UPI0024187F53|nr:hypothetical protein [Nocardioides convexus]
MSTARVSRAYFTQQTRVAADPGRHPRPGRGGPGPQATALDPGRGGGLSLRLRST